MIGNIYLSKRNGMKVVSELHITKTPTGRKEYKCQACGYMIEKGEKHVQNEGFYEGEPYRYRVHNECNDELLELSIAGEYEFSPFELDPPERLTTKQNQLEEEL